MDSLPRLTASPQIEELTTIASLEAIRPQWRDLCSRSSSCTPFQMPEWIIPWWKHFGHDKLLVLALRVENRLVGLAPLFIQQDEQSRERRVMLIGTGNTDYLDALASDETTSSCRKAIFDSLAAQSHRWDVCDLQQLRPGSALLESTPTICSETLSLQETCPVLRLPAEAENFSEAIPHPMLEKLRYYRRRAEKLGPVRMESANENNFEEFFGALIGLHLARWSVRGLPGVLRDDAVQRFHRDVMLGMLNLRALRCYSLRLDGRIIAVFYGFSDNARAYYYLGAFDPEFHQLSPGTLLVGHAIEQALKEGAEEFHFLRGREDYKYKWGAKDRLTYRRLLWHKRQPHVGTND